MAGTRGNKLTQPARRPRRRPPRRGKPVRRICWRWAAGAAVIAAVVLVAIGALLRRMAPQGNTTLLRFDSIIVLGAPADRDGNPTPVQLARVTEAVHEYERGAAAHIIVSGGQTTNFVEAKIMARIAEAQGVPESAIVVEPDAMDTIHNACYSARIMKARGWGSAEVVSSAPQLPRAGLIFSRLPVLWRVHAAPDLTPASGARDAATAGLEVLKTVRYLVWARWAEHCEP